MPKYLLFAGWDDTVDGGWSDFIISTDSLVNIDSELDKAFDGMKKYDWFHIVDTEKMEIVAFDRESFVALACTGCC